VGITYTYHHTPSTQPRVRWALMLILGGAIGNLIDRLRIGYVIDFVEWFYGDFTWPNFNVADIGISVGVGLLVLDMILTRKSPPAEATPPPPASTGG
jgi:signal peptidase II